MLAKGRLYWVALALRWPGMGLLTVYEILLHNQSAQGVPDRERHRTATNVGRH
jgi:hypothetical protein